ncbi:hypothetical protein L1887_60187 [Cichorium endivia]|nr:hypothetical protein L1887_63348 [Cichorium endivia]KAI3476751.1 hypothetical protein L1887_61669 [Cichorium endivia]KAI3477923.1 hypothetical protein L1887_60187 [Cichorium endivia]
MEAPVNGGSNSNCPKRRKSAIVIRESRVEGLSLNGSKRRAAKLVWKNCCAAGNPSLYKFSDEEKVTILSCLVSAFSPPLFSPRLGRFFRFFNESLHESCNRIKDILSSRSVCLMPSIESIGAISSLGGRAIDSSCPWLVKGMRRCKSIQIDRGVPNQQQALSNVLGEGSAGESPIDPIFLIAPHSSRPGTKKSLRWADANLDLSTEQFHSSRSLNPIFNVPSPPCLTPSIFLSGVSQAAKPFILIKERVFPPSINGIGLSELLTAVKANRESQFSWASIAEAKKSNQCSFRAQPKDPILAAAGALDGTGKTVHE